MANEVLLETENLVKTFGTFRAVDGLNLQVRAGEIGAAQLVAEETGVDHFAVAQVLAVELEVAQILV